MSEVDGWSDSQIREKFEELGSPAPPITATTKKIMLKRLKALMANGGNPVSKPNEEEPVEEDEPDAPPLPPTRIPRRLGRSALAALNQTNNQSLNDNTLSGVSPIMNGDGDSSRVSRSKSPGRKSLGRTSEPSPVLPSPVKSSPSRNKEPRTRSPGRKSLGRTSDFDTPEVNNEEIPTRKLTPGRRIPESEETFASARGISPSRISFGSFGVADLELRKSAERIMQDVRDSVVQEVVGNEAFRSRLVDSSSTPFQSNFMKKLSSQRKSSFSVDDDDILSDDEDSLKSPVRVTRGNKPTGYEVKSAHGGRVFPVTLFFAFLIPFTIIIGFYGMFINTPQEIAQTKLMFPFCTGSANDIPGRNCIERAHQAQLSSIFDAFNSAVSEIRQTIPCTTSYSQPVFVDNDSIKELTVSKDDRISVLLVEKMMDDLKVLVDANSHLNVRCKTDGVSLIKGPDSFICNLRAKIVLLAEWIVRIGITIIVGVISYLSVQWYWTQQQKHKEDVAFAIDKILDMTKTRRFLVVDQMEKELTSLGFSKAVITEAFDASCRDSRVTLDSKNNVTGLRWISEPSPNYPSTLWGNNHYDQPASFVLPPSVCLKIRGMFSLKTNMNDSDIRELVDSILLKSVGNRIVHAVVDRKSPEGIVYLRCQTRTDAGGVYRNLNGSLFEGRPVTVKFVSENRYDEKFPDSSKYSRPLRPSAQR